MARISTLVDRFPEYELAIHRLWTRDGEFRAICGDYEDAVAALRHWEDVEPPPGERAQEYRQLVSELEAEILQMVDGNGRA
jgi:hypothetical protein